jgi:hypothetical protein
MKEGTNIRGEREYKKYNYEDREKNNNKGDEEK